MAKYPTKDNALLEEKVKLKRKKKTLYKESITQHEITCPLKGGGYQRFVIRCWRKYDTLITNALYNA